MAWAVHRLVLDGLVPPKATAARRRPRHSRGSEGPRFLTLVLAKAALAHGRNNQLTTATQNGLEARGNTVEIHGLRLASCKGYPRHSGIRAGRASRAADGYPANCGLVRCSSVHLISPVLAAVADVVAGYDTHTRQWRPILSFIELDSWTLNRLRGPGAG